MNLELNFLKSFMHKIIDVEYTQSEIGPEKLLTKLLLFLKLIERI